MVHPIMAHTNLIILFFPTATQLKLSCWISCKYEGTQRNCIHNMMYTNYYVVIHPNSHHKFFTFHSFPHFPALDLGSSWLSALHPFNHSRASPAVWSSASPPRRSAPGSGSIAPRTSCWCLSWWESSHNQPGITWWGWTLLEQQVGWHWPFGQQRGPFWLN